MQDEAEFYCPVYEGEISRYDCDEISTGIYRGSFVNDGIPFLMELETALSRRHRCHACGRCPAHDRPRGGSALPALRHLGYSQGGADEIEGMVMDTIKRHAAGHALKLEGRFGCCQLPGGIQLWYEWDPQLGLPVDVQAHYATANGAYMLIETLDKSGSYGRLARSRVFAGLRGKKLQEEALVRGAMAAPNLNMYREDFIREDLVVQVCAFPEELAYFDSVKGYNRRRKNRLAEESFVSGTAFDEFGRPNMPEHGMMTGVVKSAAKAINEETGLPFYHLEVSCLGMVIDVAANPDLFPALPREGAVVQGVFRFSARVIDFWYTGYDFNIAVETPLTMPRFETIRAALANMQPGERMSCDLTGPLGSIEQIRVKCEVEGMSVEFKVTDDEQNMRVLRFYPISREEGIKVFMQTLVYENPPMLDDALDVTGVYQKGGDGLAPESG